MNESSGKMVDIESGIIDKSTDFIVGPGGKLRRNETNDNGLVGEKQQRTITAQTELGKSVRKSATEGYSSVLNMVAKGKHGNLLIEVCLPLNWRFLLSFHQGRYGVDNHTNRGRVWSS